MQAHLKQFEKQLPPIKKKQTTVKAIEKREDSPSEDEALKLIEEYEIQIRKSKQKLKAAERKKQSQMELMVDQEKSKAKKEREDEKYKKLGLAAQSKEYELQVHIEQQSPTNARSNALNAGTSSAHQSSFLAESMDKKWRSHSRRVSNEHDQQMLPEIHKKKKPHHMLSEEENEHLPRKKIQRKMKRPEQFTELPQIAPPTQSVRRQDSQLQKRYGTSNESGRPSLKSLEIAYSEKRMAKAKKQVAIQKKNNEIYGVPKTKATGVNFGPPFGYYQKQGQQRAQQQSQGGARSLHTPAGSTQRTQERYSNEKKYLPPKSRPPPKRDRSKPTLMGSVSSSDKPIVRVLRSPPSGQEEPSHQRQVPQISTFQHNKSYSDEATSTRQLNPPSPRRQYPSHLQVQIPSLTPPPVAESQRDQHPELQIVQAQLLKHLRDLSPQQLNDFLSIQTPEMLKMSLDILTHQQEKLKKQIVHAEPATSIEKQSPQRSPPPFEIQKQATEKKASPFQQRQKSLIAQPSIGRQKTNKPGVAVPQKQQSYYRIIQQQKTQLALLQSQDPNEELYNTTEKSLSVKRATTAQRRKTSPLKSAQSSLEQKHMITPISKATDEISEGDMIISEISRHYQRKSQVVNGNQLTELRIEENSRNYDLESVMMGEDEEMKDTVLPIIAEINPRKSVKQNQEQKSRKSNAVETFEHWYHTENGLPPPPPFVRKADSPARVSPTAAAANANNSLGRKSVMPSKSQMALLSGTNQGLKKQATKQFAPSMTLQNRLNGSPQRGTIGSLSKTTKPILQVFPPSESPSPQKQILTPNKYSSPMKSSINSSASKRKSMSVSQTLMLQSNPQKLLKQKTSAMGKIGGLKKQSPSRMSIMQQNTAESENTFGAYTVDHLPAGQNPLPRKSLHLPVGTPKSPQVEESKADSSQHDPFAHIQSLLHQAHKIMNKVHTHRGEKQALEEKKKKEEEERVAQMAKIEEEQKKKAEEEELLKNRNYLPHVVKDGAKQLDTTQLQADAQERVDRLLKHLERREEIRADKLRRPDPIINLPEEYEDEKVFNELLRTETMEQDLLSSRMRVVTKQIKQLINLNRGTNPSEEVYKYIEQLQDNSYRDYPSPKHLRDQFSKSVSPKLIGRGLQVIPQHLRDPTLRLYQSILDEDRNEITLSYQDNSPIMPNTMHKHHRSQGDQLTHARLGHHHQSKKSRSDLSMTLEFMAKEREKALRYRLPLESNLMQLSDVKYRGKETLDLYPEKTEVTFNLDEKDSPDFYRYDARILDYLTSSKEATDTQLKALKLQHEEMRQRCERVLGTYEYEKELEREIERTQETINTEIVVKGKLKYLSKMFSEIDIHQTMELIHEQRQQALQTKVETVLQAIGEASTESDHLMFRINQMASKYNDTDIVKQQLEMEFTLLQEKAKRLQITPIITQKQLIYKSHIDKLKKDIEKCKADVENERVLFEIKVNKFKHDTKVFRKEVLANQGILQQKLRINENQRLIILDLMSAQEAYSEAVRTQHGDMKEYESNQARAGSHQDDLLRDLRDEFESNVPVLPSNTDVKESNDDKDFNSGNESFGKDQQHFDQQYDDPQMIPDMIDGRPSTVNKHMLPEGPSKPPLNERDLFTYSIVKHNTAEEGGDDLLSQQKQVLMEQIRNGTELLESYNYLLQHEM